MFKKQHLVKGLAVVTAISAFQACKSKPASEFEGYEKSESGLFYNFVKHDEKGAHPKEGDVMSLKFKIKLTKNDSILHDTKAGSQDGSGYIEMPLFKKTFTGSIEEGLMMLAKGDTASFIISADSFFLKTQRMEKLPPFVKPGEKITFDVSLKDFITKEQKQKETMEKMEQAKAAEAGKMQELLKKHNVTSAPTASGLYIIEKVKGKGAKIKKGDVVQAHYKGTLADGSVFDSSENSPQVPEFSAGVGQVIAGWDEALLTMSVGTEAILIIPSNLAYGEQGGGPIPPYSPLAFELKVVGIKAAK